MPRVIRVSAAQCQVSVDQTTPAADGVDVTTVYVTVEQDRNDAEGEPLPFSKFAASNVTITASPSTGVTITQPTGTSDAFGTVTGSFVSTSANTIAIGASAFGTTITGTATVVVGGGYVPPAPAAPFYTQPTTVGNVFAADNGFTWASRLSTVSEQVVPAGKSGYGIRYRYGPDAVGEDTNTEQRFALGQDLTEVWFQYDLWVPENYVHRNDTGPDNNKFFRLWGDDYTSRNKVGFSTRPLDGTGPDSNLFGEYVKTGETGLTEQGTCLFGDDTMRGAWTQIRVHAKIVSSEGAADAVLQIWKDGVLSLDLQNLDQRFVSGQNYWNNGYTFGAANSGFLEETDLYTYELKVYNTDPGWT